MKRNKFSLSHYRLFSMNMGFLTPMACVEVLPGDTLQQATSALIRCSPMMAPVMHPVHVRIHHWFVPMRLLWNEWEDFITGGPDGMNESEFPVVDLNPEDDSIGSLADYLGYPPNTGFMLTSSALPFRAYALIWNEWYRDQDLQEPLPISLESGNDAITSRILQRVAWEKDYFTSARPFPQKGPDVFVPGQMVGSGTAPVEYYNPGTGVYSSVLQADGELARNPLTIGVNVAGGGEQVRSRVRLDTVAEGVQMQIGVNDLREALAIQRYEEARMRFGSRYTEYLRYLGVRSSDARLQRPEYLGGGKQTIQFSEVLQTAEGSNPVGEMRGHGIGAMRSNRYRRFFEEHGYIISMISVKPKTIYTQGVPRSFNRRTKEDFFQKELQHIGQQEILNKELYAGHHEPEATFGYQDRYDEYRRQESSVAGEFRTSTLDYWHFAREFGSEPALNADFISAHPTLRPFASQINDVLYVMASHSIQARRLLSKVGTSFTF